MPEPRSAEAVLTQMQANAAKQLTEFVLLHEVYWEEGRGARWLIGRPQDVHGRTEIIAGIFGSLVVHGDYDTSRFASYGDRADAWSRLLWMADCRDLSYYVAQKATIGGDGRRDAAWQYAEDVALYDLERLAKDYDEDQEDSSRAIAALLREAKAFAEDERELRTFLNHRDKGWDLWELTIGRSPRWGLVVGHALLGRCAALLREKHGDAGPPECRRRP